MVPQPFQSFIVERTSIPIPFTATQKKNPYNFCVDLLIPSISGHLCLA